MRKCGREEDIILSVCLNCIQCGQTPLSSREFHLPFSSFTFLRRWSLFLHSSCFQPDDHFGHLGDFSAPFQVLPAETRERERLLDKTGSVETLTSLSFQAQKPSKPLICIHFQRTFACLQIAAWMPGLRMNQLGNYPTANFEKQSSVWSETH